MGTSPVEQAQALVANMLGKRTRREYQWRRLSRWICPYRGCFLGRERGTWDVDEMIRFTHVASHAVLKAASGITSGMTPDNISWFSPQFADEGVIEATGARQWLDMVDRAMKDCLDNGRFYQAIQEFNTDLLWAGCALLYSEKADHNPLIYEAIQIGTFAVETDRSGDLLAVARQMRFTARELAAEFGRDSVSERVRKLLDLNPWELINVWQLVRVADKGRFPVSSQFWEEGEPEKFLRQHGYNEMPFFFARWHDSDDPYGVGPGDSALPDAMQLDQLERRKLDGIGKITEPPVGAHSSLQGHIDLSPGRINYMNERHMITPILDMGPFASFFGSLLQEIMTVTQRINEALWASVFETVPLAQRPKDMTAAEFLERKNEALQQLGTVMRSYRPQVLNPLLHRTIQTLNRASLLPPLPDSLLQQGYQPLMRMEFSGPMANAMRQTDGQAMTAFLQNVGGIAQVTQNPEVFDKLNVDQMVDEYATIISCPGSVVRSDEEVMAIRQQRQQMQAAQQQMAMAQQQAEVNQMEASTANQAMQAAGMAAQMEDAGLFG